MASPAHIPDEIYFPPPSSSTSAPDSDIYHILFVPGNPGCIAYYQTFLATLHQQVNDPTSSSRSAVYGRSLRGFEIHASSSHSPVASHFKKGPWGLQAEIDFTEVLLHTYVTKLAKASTSNSKQKPKLILIGHSLGTYIILELLRRRNERLRKARQKGEWSRDAEVAIEAAVLLFPTVVDIAKSPNGRTIGWVAGLPYAAAVVSTFARLLVGALKMFGAAVLLAVGKWFTNMPDDSAAVTAAWLMTKGGVYQSLHLAKDEMKEMTEDKWDDEIWGAAASATTEDEEKSKSSRTKLFFYYSAKDHWIADHTRDGLIAIRGRRTRDMAVEKAGGIGHDQRPIMDIDDGDVPHGFCIRKWQRRVH